MKTPNLVGLVITVLCINILLLLSGVQLIENDFMNKFIDVDAYLEEDNLVLQDDFKGTAPDNYEGTSTSGGVLAFGIDALRAIKNFLIFIVNIVFTPLALFGSLPAIFGVIIGLPLVVFLVFALVTFVRSGR